MVLGGRLDFNPLTDSLTSKEGDLVQLDPPVGEELPDSGFDVEDLGYEAPAQDSDGIVIDVDPDSDRLQVLTPFSSAVAGWTEPDTAKSPPFVPNVMVFWMVWVVYKSSCCSMDDTVAPPTVVQTLL